MKHYLAAFFAKEAPSHIEVAFKPAEPFKPLVGVNVDKVEQRLTEAWDSAVSRKIQLEIEIGRLKGELANTERAILAYDAALVSIKPAPLEPFDVMATIEPEAYTDNDDQWAAAIEAAFGQGDDTTVEEDNAALTASEVAFQTPGGDDTSLEAWGAEGSQIVKRDYKPLTVGKIEVDFHPVTGAMSSKVVHP